MLCLFFAKIASMLVRLVCVCRYVC